jgi:hypothetical protein
MAENIEEILGTAIAEYTPNAITVIGVKDLDFAGEFVRFVRGCDEMEISSQKLYAWWD